jgi:hypothetical protein
VKYCSIENYRERVIEVAIIGLKLKEESLGTI